jgi:hypothetical protein
MIEIKRVSTPREINAYYAARSLIRRGIKPTPTRLNEELGHRRRKMNVLNGEECRGRTRALEEASYTKNEATGRWDAP